MTCANIPVLIRLQETAEINASKPLLTAQTVQYSTVRLKPHPIIT